MSDTQNPYADSNDEQPQNASTQYAGGSSQGNHYGSMPPPYGAAHGANYFVQKPDNYLIWGILTTAFCCLPFGILAIINSMRVDDAWNFDHNYPKALSYARKARNWCLWGAAIGALGYFLVIALYALGVIALLGIASAAG